MNISALTRAYAPVAPSSRPAAAARNTAPFSPDVVVQISAAGRAAAGVDQVGPWPVDRVGPWGDLKADQAGPMGFNQALRMGPWGI